MKKSDAKKLARRKRNLKKRLDRKAAFKSPDYNLDYEISDRVSGTSHGGVAALLELARATGLSSMFDASVAVLKQHRPFKESDHILSIIATVLAGGTCPEDLRRLRQDPQFLDSLDMNRFPDSTTCGDFLDRFEKEDIGELSHAALDVTENVLCAQLSAQERQLGTVDADGTVTPTDAECMEGIDLCAYKRQWGYAPLLISLANTQQPLLIVNRPGNAPSSKDAAGHLDTVAASMLRVFERILFRGDTDFSQTIHLDRWDATGRIDFVFGFDACQALVGRAEKLDADAWRQLKRPARYEVKTSPRQKPERIKDQIVSERGYRNLRLLHEDIAEFDYKPTACQRSYRMVVVRKQIEVTEGQLELEPITRYFFYITNLRDASAEQIVLHANRRCNQENLIAQLKGQVHSLTTTSGTLESNWAWMVIASLAWTLKSWFALFAADPDERKRLLGMEFHTFRNCFMELPVQIVKGARRVLMRIIGGHLPSLEVFLNIWADIRCLRRIRI